MRVTEFIEARLTEVMQAAMAASGIEGHPAAVPEHWWWECTQDDVVLSLGTDVYDGAAGQMLYHCDDWRVSLRSTVEYPSGGTGSQHLVIDTVEPVRPADARHIMRHDPDQAARMVKALRKQVEVIGRMVESREIGWLAAATLYQWIASAWDDHPDYRKHEGAWTS